MLLSQVLTDNHQRSMAGKPPNYFPTITRTGEEVSCPGKGTPTAPLERYDISLFLSIVKSLNMDFHFTGEGEGSDDQEPQLQGEHIAVRSE